MTILQAHCLDKNVLYYLESPFSNGKQVFPIGSRVVSGLKGDGGEDSNIVTIDGVAVGPLAHLDVRKSDPIIAIK